MLGFWCSSRSSTRRTRQHRRQPPRGPEWILLQQLPPIHLCLEEVLRGLWSRGQCKPLYYTVHSGVPLARMMGPRLPFLGNWWRPKFDDRFKKLFGCNSRVWKA